MNVKQISRQELPEIIRREFGAGRGFALTVTGSSMEPLLRHLRDKVVLVKPDGPYTPGCGDVVLFHRPSGEYVMHRIVKACGSGVYAVNGDAQSWTERIRRDQIDAVAAEFIRNGRCFSRDGRFYRIYVCIWRFTRPFRPGIFRSADTVRACIRRIKKND